jgi:hypothetical protein
MKREDVERMLSERLLEERAHLQSLIQAETARQLSALRNELRQELISDFSLQELPELRHRVNNELAVQNANLAQQVQQMADP